MNNILDECGGGYFYTLNGTITSPSYPDLYPENEDCTYKIWQLTGNFIQNQFLSIDIENDEYNGSCSYDYIEIRDGPSEESPLIAKLCGTEKPANIQSSTNHLWIK